MGYICVIICATDVLQCWYCNGNARIKNGEKHFMKRWIRNVCLTILMLTLLLPGAAFAEETAAAQVDDKIYETVQAAVDAADAEKTVTLLAPAELTDALKVAQDKNLTLDLNGYTLDVTPSSGNFSIINYGTLTVKNGTVTKTNGYGIYNGTEENAASSGSVTLEDVNVITKDCGVYFAAGNCTVKNSTITVTAGKDESPYGVYANGNGSVVLEGVTVHSAFAGVYTSQNTAPDVTLTSCEIHGDVRALIQWGSGNITASGTKFVANNNNVIELNNGHTVLTEGCSLWQGDSLGGMQVSSNGNATIQMDATTQYQTTWQEYALTKYSSSNPISESDYLVDENGDIHVYTADGLAWWAAQVNKRLLSPGYTLYLEAERLDMASYPWSPVNGNSSWLDGVTIQGRAEGATIIDNLKVVGFTDGTYYSGFIGDINGVKPAKIANLTFDHMKVEAANGNIVAAVLGRANNGSMTMENVAVVNSQVQGYGKVAALVGQANGDALTLKNCTVDNSTTIAGAYNCGSLVGLKMDRCELTIENCIADAKWQKAAGHTYVCYNGAVEYLNAGDVKLEEPLPVSGVYCKFEYAGEYLGYYAAWGNEYTDYTVYYNLDDNLSDFGNTLLVVGICHDAAPHTGFHNWQVTVQPTDTTPGEETGTCNIDLCDEVGKRYFWNVTLNRDDGTAAEVIPVYFAGGEEAKLAEPGAPARDGYTFEGWYLGDQKFDFAQPITANLTLIAKWTEKPVPASEPATPAPAPDTAAADGHPEIAQAIQNGTWGKAEPTPAPSAAPAAAAPAASARVPQTGDAFNPVLWGAVMAAALAALLAVAVLRRRSGRN